MKNSYLILLAFIFAIIQISILPKLPFNFVPNLLLICVLFVSFFKGKAGLFYGFFIGLFMDVFFSPGLGFLALFLTLIAFGLSLLAENMYKYNIVSYILIVFFTEILFEVYYLLINKKMSAYLFVHQSLPNILYTTIIGLLFFVLCRPREKMGVV